MKTQETHLDQSSSLKCHHFAARNTAVFEIVLNNVNSRIYVCTYIYLCTYICIVTYYFIYLSITIITDMMHISTTTLE